MEIKSYIIENNIKKIKDYPFILLYGENRGLTNFLKQSFKKICDKEVINFFQDELIKNEGLLIEEMDNSSLFGKDKLIIIHEASDKIFEQIKNNFKTNTDNTVLIISDVLDRKSKLRDFFSKGENCALIACYNDSERTLVSFIKSELADFRNLDQQTINTIIVNSNSNRLIAKNELEKIKTCFPDKILDLNKVNNLLNYKEAESFEKARDAALSGEKEKLNIEISSANFMNDNILLYFNLLSSRMLRLLEAKKINEENKNIEFVLQQLKPKLFWKEKNAFLDQLNKWSLKKLNIALQKLNEFDKEIKKNFNQNNDIMLKQLLINLCNIVVNPLKV